ncbi:MAG: polyprenyl synthetase family protein [Desulfovibrionaceae bacterium]|nr:polyprenyl synthetase family protein [Desulfovibrionaceae bacterium]MBF0514011.1 polyprenyl synthetase family protein [Desulfovibrionaceae bacterium]
MELTAFMSQELPRIEGLLREKTDSLSEYVRPCAGHVLAAGGKRLRPLLTILSARAFGYGGDVLPLACAMEFLHSATLLHDDIVDGSRLRRGKPAAHTVFDQTAAILTGDALLALANRMVAELGDARLTQLLSEAILQTATGEIMEVAHIRDFAMPVGKYLEIITGKTARLIEAACLCGAVLAGAGSEGEDAAKAFGLNLGIAFQLADDALDYTSDALVAGKTTGADLREGKPTLPLLLFLCSLPSREATGCLEILSDDGERNRQAETLLKAVTEGGFAEQTRDRAQAYIAKAEDALAKFPDAPHRKLLRQSLSGAAKREK